MNTDSCRSSYTLALTSRQMIRICNYIACVETAIYYLQLLPQAKLKEKIEAAGGRLRSGTTGIASSESYPLIVLFIGLKFLGRCLMNGFISLLICRVFVHHECSLTLSSVEISRLAVKTFLIFSAGGMQL